MAGQALGDNLRLYVYDGISLVASSDGASSLSQSVLIEEPENATFRVYAVYDVASPSQQIAYEGLAEVEYAPPAEPVRRLLPDLEARLQQHVTFDPGPIFANAISSSSPSCYYTEVEEEGARTCLRFDQVFANVGEGQMEVRFAVPRGSGASTHTAYQRVYWSSGSTPFEDLATSEVELHPGHSHYHVMTFALSRLWRVDDQSDRQRPTGLEMVRSGEKVSFCMVDTEIDRWAQKGDGPKTWKAPDCNYPLTTTGGVDYYAQGITPGWKDVYEWYLPHQYIDVTGLPDGLYILETIADPENLLVEADESNNCGTVYVRMSGVSSASPQAALVEPGPSCAVLVESR